MSAPNSQVTESATFTAGGVTAEFSVTTGYDGQPPQGAITFPSNREFVATGDSIVIRGTASDDSGVAAVYVNDILATTSDNFANWQAQAYLAPDSLTDLSITVKDIYGNILDLDNLRVKVPGKVESQRMDSIAWDFARGKLYTSGYLGIFDPNTGIRSDMPLVGQGPAEWARFVMYDNINARLFGFKGTQIFEFNRNTGESLGLVRETQSSNIHDTALDASLGRIYWIADFSLRYYDLNSNTETVLSNDGGILGRDSRVAAAGGRVFVSDKGNEWVYEIDANSGTKRFMFNSVDWDHVETMTASESGDMLYVIADGATSHPYPTVYRINPDTSTFAHLGPTSSAGELANFNLQSADMVVDETNNRLLISASRSNHLIRISLTDSSASWFTMTHRGSGIPIAGENTLRPLALDEQGNRVLVASSSYVDAYDGGSSTESPKLIAADQQTGNREEHSGPTRGSGPLFDNIAGVDVGPSGTAYVIDSTVEGGAIIAVDPATGDRDVITSEDTSLGLTMTGGSQISISSDENTAWYLDSGDTIVAVDMLTGSGTVLTDGTGTYSGGDNWSGIIHMDVDKESRVAYVFGNVSGNFKLFQVDLETGKRTVLNPNLTLNILSPWSILYSKPDNSILLASSRLYRFDIGSETLEQVHINGIAAGDDLGGLARGKASDHAYFSGVGSRFIGELDISAASGAVISW
nr:Ig-like domain-containing protein [Microbulbifer sediminum]